MDRLRGVHVRLPDGSEDVYVDEFRRREPGVNVAEGVPAAEHYYTLMQDGFLFVFRTEFGESNTDVTGHRRVALYAPGGWHRVRSRWIPFTGPREYEHLARYD